MFRIEILWLRLTSMSLAPTNTLLQNSKKFERSGSNVKKKKTTIARLRKSERALRTEAAKRLPIPINLQAGRITHLGPAGLNSLRLVTLRPVVKFHPVVTQAEWIRCTKPRGTARYTRSIRTRPMAKGNRCMKKLNEQKSGNRMLTCGAETNNLNRYAPPGIGLLWSKLSFSSMIRVRYPKRLVKSI